MNQNIYGLNMAEELKKVYDAEFLNGITEWRYDDCEKGGRCLYCNNLFGGPYIVRLEDRLLGGYGEMTGPKGGFIEESKAFLEMSYAAEETLISKLAISILPKLEERGIGQEEELAVIRGLRELLGDRERDGTLRSGSRIPKKYLKDVCEKTCQYFQEHECLPELEDLYTDELWETRFKRCQSVVNVICCEL